MTDRKILRHTAIFAICIGSILFAVSKEQTFAAEIDYANIYNRAVESVVSDVERMGGDTDWLQYALYDMDQDGDLEFFIQKGTCNADMGYEIYTTDGSDCVYLGQALGQAQEIYADAENHGIYTYFGRQWVVTISQVTLENGEIKSEIYFGGEDKDYKNEYEVLQQQIKTRSLGEPMVWEASEIIDAAAAKEYIFPNSNTEYLSYEEVAGKSPEELLYGRNEIYARHGYIFQDEAIRAHFENTSWYVGTVTGDQFDASVFNEFELANIDLILQVEEEGANPVLDQSYDFTGEYISGTGEDDHRIVITQNGNMVSYIWYSGSEIWRSETDVPINDGGTVDIGGGGMWLEGDTTLKYTSGAGGSDNVWTFWRVK